MITFTVHEPPNPPEDRIDRAASMVFVRDGFSWSALLFTPVWMLVHRLWWPLIAYIALTSAIEIGRQSFEMHPGWLSLATLALSLLVGLEAATLRRWQLARRGWTLIGTVSGDTVVDCERRFYDAWLVAPAPSRPAAPASTPVVPPAGPLSAAQA